ncbi:TetR family transcriptional regulator [Streptomyces monashensis]|uniref:TetR family transcriptional regulator n=1 Tax=Streptomyces monashensis TaxID=1678012 RepID=A0A1S2PFE6_9ACTN|nr:TetR family transcriptional regulator [Streptomyces monashensis]
MLNSVCAEAGVTLGALTFHFRCKAELASAVVDEGLGELQRILRACPDTDRPLHDLSALLLQATTALRNNVLTRAATRLTEEGHGDSHWPGTWHAEVLRLLERASVIGELAEDVRPTTAVCLITHAVEGATREARNAGVGDVSTAPDFAEIWRAVLGGLAAGMR